LFFSLLSWNVKVEIHKTAILPFVLYGCKSWSLTLREEHRLWVLEKRVLRRIFGPSGMKQEENGGSCTVRSFILCTNQQISLGRSNKRE
jgi:hypothetical protein